MWHETQEKTTQRLQMFVELRNLNILQLDFKRDYMCSVSLRDISSINRALIPCIEHVTQRTWHSCKPCKCKMTPSAYGSMMQCRENDFNRSILKSVIAHRKWYTCISACQNGNFYVACELSNVSPIFSRFHSSKYHALVLARQGFGLRRHCWWKKKKLLFNSK